MNAPRLSVASALLVVGLAAVDLAAIRFVFHTSNRFEARLGSLLLGVLPMMNVLVVFAHRYITSPKGARRPFLVGFLVAGSIAVLLHIACDRAFPEVMFSFYRMSYDPFQKFCQRYMPWNAVLFSDGTVHWRYYPLLFLFYCWPQFLAASVGGLITIGLSRNLRVRLAT